MTEETGEVLDYRKRRRKRIKKIIVTFCVILLVLPIVMSIFLLYRVNRLENRLEELVSQNGMEAQESTQAPDVVWAEEKHREDTVSGGAVDTEKVKRVYLTFDDGPSGETEKVLDVLKEKNVKATFFVIGREDEFTKKMYRRIVSEGHTIGMHSYSHIYTQIYGELKDFKKDFVKLSDLIFDVTGVRSTYYRFPGGSSNTINQNPIEEYKTFFTEQGVMYMDWNVIAANGTSDNVSKKEMVQSVIDGVAQYDTSIVLLYDSADKRMTAKSLGAIIDRLQAEGYEILPIDASTTPVQHS